ncbi:MAG TPA: RidA family protein [Egibacteraceae bacterium]|nr:RidA family protein [Egibacteraceae bacterium]
MATPEQRLAELGIELPEAPPPAASYLPYVRTGNYVFTSGQVAGGPDGLVAEGIVGEDVDLDTAVRCARQCAINVLAQVKAAVGDLSQVQRVVKLTVFVASAPDFTQQHLVANGASELLAEVFGDAGRHARSAVGAPSLPTNTPVEVEAIVEVGA